MDVLSATRDMETSKKLCWHSFKKNKQNQQAVGWIIDVAISSKC